MARAFLKSWTACRNSTLRRKMTAVPTSRQRCLMQGLPSGFGTVMAPVPLRRKATRSSWQSLGAAVLTAASLLKSTRPSGAPWAASTPAVHAASAWATPFSTSPTSASLAAPAASPSSGSAERGTRTATEVAVHRSKASLWGSAFIVAGRMAGFAPPLNCQKDSFRVRSSMVRTSGSLMSFSNGASIGTSSLASASGATAKQPHGSSPPGSSFPTSSPCCRAQAAKSTAAFDFASATMSFGVSEGCPSSPGWGGVGAAKMTSRSRSSSASVPTSKPKRMGVP
mmetsp:Transcript_6066/g.17345  ORF Transcript_6066/g.17345 Transcript_6066/m.17345 type:complete len:282 (+) Transcript_6066:193-1038(+)